MFTFDDAYHNFLVNVCPLLTANMFDFKATLCIPTGEIPSQESEREPPPKWTEGKGPLMTWNEIRGLKSLKTKRGEDLIEFIPHSVTHRYYDELEKLSNPENEFRWEVKNSKQRLSSELGIEIDSINFYCLPGGVGEGKEIVERVLDGENYKGALRAQYKREDKWNRYRIPRCEPHSKDDLVKLLSNGKFSCN
ncbi:MAG: polysaccharide deacetylase family protein [Chloroflexi bacterium]|nr:polysaccharide deacetylase family protein [Chloroflexota bacterium]